MTAQSILNTPTQNKLGNSKAFNAVSPSDQYAGYSGQMSPPVHQGPIPKEVLQAAAMANKNGGRRNIKIRQVSGEP